MQATSKTDENLQHVVSTACRPGVFQITLFKGFPNIPHIPPRTGHTVGTNQATMTTTTENPPSWRIRYGPREICDHSLPFCYHCLGTAGRQLVPSNLGALQLAGVHLA